MRLGLIGSGKMAEAIVRGIRREAKSGLLEMAATASSQASATDATRRLGIPCQTSNPRLVEASDVVVLCVKPDQARAVLAEIEPVLHERQLLVSVCASVTTAQLVEWTGGRVPVVRTMPNTPCLIGDGMTILCGGATAQADHVAVVEKLFQALGRTVVLSESLMDGATGVSGCGPAYVYLIIEALSEAGVKVGLPRQIAVTMAAQTLLGAARMVLERGEHPAALKDEVTTPGGLTIDGIIALEEGRLRATLMRAVLAGVKRSRAMRV